MDEAVKTDGTQIEDGRRRTHDVHSNESIAKLWTKRPISHQVVGQCEWHHDARHQEVRHRQRDDEQIPKFTKTSVGAYSPADQNIAWNKKIIIP